MQKLRIGTLVGCGDAVRVVPQIISHGFESFSLTFWKTTGTLNLPETAKEIKDILAEKDIIISTVSVYGNPLIGVGEHQDIVESWERLIDNAHLFGTNVVTGFSGR